MRHPCISKNQLEYYVHCKRTIKDIIIITGYSRSTILKLFKFYDMEPYHECKYCRTENLSDLKTMKQKNKFIVLDVCDTCYSNISSIRMNEVYRKNKESIMNKIQSTTLKNYGVVHGFNKKGVQEENRKKRKIQSDEKKLARKGKKKPLAHEKYRNKDLLYQEHIVCEKSIKELSIQWKCQTHSIIKYLNLYNIPVVHRCFHCGSVHNLVTISNSVCDICKSCYSKNDSMRVISYADRRRKSLNIEKNDLVILHNQKWMSPFDIAKYYGVSKKYILQLFEYFHIEEVIKCKYCGDIEDLQVRIIGNKEVKCYLCRSCHAEHASNNRSNYSKISQELFWSIYKKLPEHLQKQTFFYELNNEYYIPFDKYAKEYFGVNKSGCRLDFCVFIGDYKFVIEFNGDVFHANPKLFKEDDHPHPRDKSLSAQEIWEHDSIRNEFIECNESYLLTIWEKDYKKHKNLCTEFCLSKIHRFEKMLI